MLSAFFAALTTIFAKIGIENIDANFPQESTWLLRYGFSATRAVHLARTIPKSKGNRQRCSTSLRSRLRVVNPQWCATRHSRNAVRKSTAFDSRSWFRWLSSNREHGLRPISPRFASASETLRGGGLNRGRASSIVAALSKDGCIAESKPYRRRLICSSSRGRAR